MFFLLSRNYLDYRIPYLHETFLLIKIIVDFPRFFFRLECLVFRDPIGWHGDLENPKMPSLPIWRSPPTFTFLFLYVEPRDIFSCTQVIFTLIFGRSIEPRDSLRVGVYNIFILSDDIEMHPRGAPRDCFPRLLRLHAN